MERCVMPAGGSRGRVLLGLLENSVFLQVEVSVLRKGRFILSEVSLASKTKNRVFSLICGH
jgi:hypothetical protein